MPELIGQISLNISFVLYLFLLWPQIIHNAGQASVKNLSFLMHFILFVAYAADLVYGFGQHFPWQYKAVTVSGLVSLSVQHYQFWAYGDKTHNSFRFLCFVLYTFMLFCFYLLFWETAWCKEASLGLGFVSQGGWLIYTIPQIVRNFITHSVKALSPHFLLLAFTVTLCDSISAWTLNWALPSKIGAPVSLFFKSVLLLQYYYFGVYRYRHSSSQANSSVVSSQSNDPKEV